jgi:hypothetical protein
VSDFLRSEIVVNRESNHCFASYIFDNIILFNTVFSTLDFHQMIPNLPVVLMIVLFVYLIL